MLNGIDYIDNRFSPTGIRQGLFSNVTSTIQINSLNPSETYILSYWSDGRPLDVNGGIIAQSIPAVAANNWYLFEYEVTGVSSLTLTPMVRRGMPFAVTGVDELRLYPKRSRMSTVCYDPVRGKICESDENNRTIYYTYDPLGTLIMIQDQSRSAVKTFEYQNRIN